MNWGIANTDDLQQARLTLNRFAEVAFALRREAQGGDPSKRRVADALESVLRLRIAAAIARQNVAARRKHTWWERWTQLAFGCRSRGAVRVRLATEQADACRWREL